MQPGSTPDVRSSVFRAVGASTIGTIVEWYDFYIYGTAAALVLNKLFFPTLDPLAGILARIIHEKCAIKAKPLISLTTMRMGCLMKFFAMKFLAQVFGGLGRFRAVR